MSPQRPPNIVLMVMDDLGIGDLAPYGGTHVRAHTVERLARNGLVCHTMYAAAATDTPSRAGLLTGRFGARFSLPASLQPGQAPGLPGDVPTIATMLQEAGYATGLFGQWRLGDGAGQHPLDRGFDRFDGTLYGSDVTPLAWYRDRDVVEPDVDPGLAARRLSGAAEEFVRDVGGKDQPVFVMLSHLVPHVPVRPDPRFAGTSRAGAYGDAVEGADHYLGEFLRRLRSTRRYGETLVIVTSDNGPYYEGSNLDLRGRKPEVMDGAVRVPFVAAWLTGRHGRTDTVPRSLVDVLPTIATLAGATAPADLDGEDMSSLVTGGEAARGPVYLFHNEWLNAMREGNWKLHVAYGNDQRAYMPALYDVSKDRRESVNIAELFPNVVANLGSRLEAVRDDVDAEVAARANGGAA